MAQTLGDSGTGGMKLPAKRGQYGIKTDGKKATFTRGVDAPGVKRKPVGGWKQPGHKPIYPEFSLRRIQRAVDKRQFRLMPAQPNPKRAQKAVNKLQFGPSPKKHKISKPRHPVAMIRHAKEPRV